MVQTIRMPVQVYSGIAPPQDLLNSMANNTSIPQSHQQQTHTESSVPQSAPVPPAIPEEAPPSYEDALADELAPVDGPRRDYAQAQQQPGPTGSTEKRGWGERLFPESGR